MTTLFNLDEYHVELPPDPNIVPVEVCLERIKEAEADGNAAWISMMQHWIFRHAMDYSEADYEKIFQARELAAEKVARNLMSGAAAKAVENVFGRVS